MISTRNQLSGVVKSLSRGLVSAEVVIVTEFGLEVSSIITLGSCLRMALEPGDKVTAAIKASDVLLAVGDEYAISARNHVSGTVKEIITGKVSDEVVIDAQGGELVSVITRASVERLGLTQGSAVAAVVKASNVILMK